MSCSYLSPKTQNDIIDMIGCDVIHASIVNEVQKARNFLVRWLMKFPVIMWSIWHCVFIMLMRAVT